MPCVEGLAYFIAFTKRTKAVIESLSPDGKVHKIDLEGTLPPSERTEGECWIEIEGSALWFVYTVKTFPYQIRMTLESVKDLSSRIKDAPDVPASSTVLQFI